MKTTKITSKSVQSRVFNKVMKNMQKAIRPYGSYSIREDNLSTARRIVIWSQESFFGDIHSHSLVEMINAVYPYTVKYPDVFFLIETTERLNQGGKLEKVPAFVILIGIKNKE